MLVKPNHNIDRISEEIGVSEATLRNWEKLGVSKRDHAAKLTSRANKRHSQKVFKPEEYSVNADLLMEIDRIVAYVTDNQIDISIALFLAATNVSPLDSNPFFAEEIKSWNVSIGDIPKTHAIWFYENPIINTDGDYLGLLYQSLLSEGKKATGGSYYTPQRNAQEMVCKYCTPQSSVLDPACGTGQFLLEAANIVDDPRRLFGIDCDEIAVRICRINLMRKFSSSNFKPNVFHANALQDFHTDSLFDIKNSTIPMNFFDVVITNPPWGGHLSRREKTAIEKQYRQIQSGETFSYFLVQATSFAKKGGIISFLLPESVLNVKVHSDIREFLSKNVQIQNIANLGRIFSGVYTPVVRFDLCNQKPEKPQVLDSIFSIFQSNEDRNLLEKIFSQPHLSLKNNAQFALGIVTGNNARHLLKVQSPQSEPIFRGKNVDSFVLKPSTEYIVFDPPQFQQVASEKLYRAKEKLIYRFISKDIVFAFDDQQRLTLNSANIMIPSIPDYPMKVLAAVLNSDLIRFVYRIKFNTIKVLRGNLEELPIPDLSTMEKSEIHSLVAQYIGTKKTCIMDRINSIVFKYFTLNESEIRYITEFMAS